MDISHIKTDEKSVLLLCNSLNAVSAAMRHYNDHHLAALLLRAQCTITKLHKENLELRKEKEAAK